MNIKYYFYILFLSISFYSYSQSLEWITNSSFILDGDGLENTVPNNFQSLLISAEQLELGSTSGFLELSNVLVNGQGLNEDNFPASASL